MDTLVIQEKRRIDASGDKQEEHFIKTTDKHLLNGFSAKLINLKNVIAFFKVAHHQLKSYKKSIKAFRKLLSIQRSVCGGIHRKWVYANGKHHFMLYAPGFPSLQLNRMYEMEINRMIPGKIVSEIRFAFFAITKKCPLSCQHCFEWEKLNSKELLSFDDLRSTVIKLKEMGIVQLHLSGGEPMLRVNDIAKLSREFSNEIEFYILTSGFNATYENLDLLKKSGVTGINISLDHYDKNLHNTFRGSVHAYDDAINAVRYARSLDMLVTLSICVTRSMATFDQLMKYAELARALDVSFIQLLEPRQVGNFSGKDILLNTEQLNILSDFFQMLNYEKSFSDFPIVIYHGYYQRKVGCFSAGNRSLYVDTNGDILLCPFCHHKSGNVLKDQITSIIPLMKEAGCPSYANAKF